MQCDATHGSSARIQGPDVAPAPDNASLHFSGYFQLSKSSRLEAGYKVNFTIR
jgi:hypothetical protein